MNYSETTSERRFTKGVITASVDRAMTVELAIGRAVDDIKTTIML